MSNRYVAWIFQIFLVVSYVSIFVSILSGAISAEPVKLDLGMLRSSFYRGEAVSLNIKCSNPDNKPVGPANLSASIAGYQAGSVLVSGIPANGQVTAALSVSIPELVFESYPLLVVLTSNNIQLAAKEVTITVTKKPNPNRLDVWLWVHGGPAGKFYQDHGFTCAGGPVWYYSGYSQGVINTARKAIDSSLAAGMDICILPNGGLWNKDFSTDKPTGPDVNYKGAKRNGDQYYNPFSPDVATAHKLTISKFMNIVGDFPNIKFAFFNSEMVDNLWANQNQGGFEQQRQMLGFDESQIGKPQYVAKGVVADNDRRYLFDKYVFKYGNGISLANKRTADTIHSFLPDILTITDPYRGAAYLDMFPGIDVLESWTYTNPDPKYMLYIETLRAAGKGTKQIPLQVVTLLNYPGTLAPTKDWMLMGPGRLKVTSWINLSRAPKILGYYYGSTCDPEMHSSDDYRVPHATSDAIKELSDRVFIPYGAMIKNLDIEPRKIAVLSSHVSRLCGASPSTAPGYANYQIYNFYAVMAMAHLNADVLFDEHIERYGLDGYKVLVMPKCDVLTKSVYNTILDFKKKGGIVIADQYLGPDIPGAIKFNFDFTYRSKVNANAIANNFAYANWDDHLDPNSAELKKVTGVTALNDQKIMESYAARLKAGLKGKVEADIDCDSPTVLLNTLEKNGAKYLVIVNDKRTYDDRIGKHKAMLGKVVPQTATIQLKKWEHPNLFAYDMLERKALATRKSGSGYSFDVNLTDIGGKIIALYPVALANISVDSTKTVKAGTACVIGIKVTDSSDKSLPGLQPILLTITDPKGNSSRYSDYYCANNGILSVNFTPAVNDEVGKWTIKVTDLTSGLSSSTYLQVQ